MTQFQFKGYTVGVFSGSWKSCKFQLHLWLKRSLRHKHQSCLWSEHGDETQHEQKPFWRGMSWTELAYTLALWLSLPSSEWGESGGPSARCFSCLGEQTGSCLWWQRDQSRGHILRSHAKVALAHPAAMFCSAARRPGIYIMLWRQPRCVCARYVLQMDLHASIWDACRLKRLNQSYNALLFIDFILGVLPSSKGISMNLILWKIRFCTVKFNNKAYQISALCILLNWSNCFH